MRLSETASKLLFGLAIPLVAGVLCMKAAEFAVATNPQLNGIEATLQQREIARLDYLKPDPRIVVVTLENETAKNLGLSSETKSIPRTAHARLIRALDKARASVALFDIAFPAPHPSEDADLKSALKGLTHLQVTISTAHEDEGDSIHETPEGLDGHLYPCAVASFEPTDHVAVGGVDELVLQSSNKFVGGEVEQLDTAANVHLLHSVVTAALQSAGEIHAAHHHDLQNYRLEVGSHVWSLNSNQALLVRWTKQVHAFPEVEYSKALELLSDPLRSQFFAGKIVVIGDYKKDEADRGDFISTEPFGFIPGSLFVAQMLNTALLPLGSGVNTVGGMVVDAWIVILAALAFHGAMSRNWLRTLLESGSAVVAAIAVPFLAVALIAKTMPILDPIVGVFLACLAGLVLSRSNLAREAHRPIGDVSVATVMFADLKGSTPLVNKIGASAYATLITDLLNRFTAIVNAHGGEVERTLGDGILAVFRDRGSRQHSMRAMDSIAELQAAVAALGAENSLDLGLTIGIESGLVSGTYVQEAGRSVWTSTGATMNLAQRLQGLCGQLGISVAVGPAAKAATESQVRYRSAGIVTPKGFADPVEVFSPEEPISSRPA